jgi:hypothetical protein
MTDDNKPMARDTTRLSYVLPRKQSFRLVARNARPVLGGTEMISADLPDLGLDHPRRERLEHRISSR